MIYNKHIRRANDASVACKIRVTSCSTTGAVTINDTAIVINVDGTKSTFDWSTSAYDTLGEFADAVNAVANVECVIVDGLRSHVTKSDWLDMISAAGTLTGDETMGATGSDGVSLGWDSSQLHKWIVSVQVEDLPSKAQNAAKSEVSDKAWENLVYEIRAKANDTNGTNTLSIYRCVGTTETLIKSVTGTATSSEQLLVDLNDGVPLSGGDPITGGRLVCIFTTDTTSTSGWIEAKGKSVNRVREAMGC